MDVEVPHGHQSQTASFTSGRRVMKGSLGSKSLTFFWLPCLALPGGHWGLGGLGKSWIMAMIICPQFCGILSVQLLLQPIPNKKKEAA